MHKTLKPLMLIALGAALGAIGLAHAAGSDTSPIDSITHARSCIFASGGWSKIDCSNVAAASSAELNHWSRYVIQCGDDSYFATGTAATGQDADTNDGWIPQGAWVEFATTATIKYVSVLNKNSDSDCRIIECL